jgi:multidrug resistance protein, MATE family
MNGAIETLVSQSFGAEDLSMCGVYLNRSRYVTVLFFIPLALGLTQTEKILRYLDQNADSCSRAQEYQMIYIWAIFLKAITDGQRVFLNMLEYSKAAMICQIVMLVLHAVFCWLFMAQLGLGVKALAWASVISNFIVLIAFLYYSWAIEEIRDALQWPDRRTFKNTMEYLRYGIPAAMLLEADFIGWNIVVYASSYIGSGFVELEASFAWF